MRLQVISVEERVLPPLATITSFRPFSLLQHLTGSKHDLVLRLGSEALGGGGGGYSAEFLWLYRGGATD